MTGVDGNPAVFTPDNEPYLGLPSLVWFDRVIVWALAGNKLVAAHTHENQAALNDLQRSSCQIIPQGINIALSIRELLRLGRRISSLPWCSFAR